MAAKFIFATVLLVVVCGQTSAQLFPTRAATTTTTTTKKPTGPECCAADEGRSPYCCKENEEVCVDGGNGMKTCSPAPTTEAPATTTTEATTTTTTTTTEAPSTEPTTTTEAPLPGQCCEATMIPSRSKFCCLRNETCSQSMDKRTCGPRATPKPTTERTTRSTTTTTTTEKTTKKPKQRCCPPRDGRSEYCCSAFFNEECVDEGNDKDGKPVYRCK